MGIDSRLRFGQIERKVVKPLTGLRELILWLLFFALKLKWASRHQMPTSL